MIKKDINALIKRLSAFDNVHIVMEATGGYEKLASHTMLASGLVVSVVNARCVRYFAKSKGVNAKTDKIDAHLLKEFGSSCEPMPSQLPSAEQQKLIELRNRREQIVKVLRQEKQHMEKATKEMQRFIKKSLKHYEAQKTDIESKIDLLIESTDEFKTKSEIIQSMKSVGKQAATTLLADLPELGKLSNKEISALVGVAPFNRDSGKLKGKRTIYGGRTRARAALYMCALSGSRYNPAIKKFYSRLLEAGKLKKTALIACAHKILVTLNAMMKNNEPWQADFGV